MADAKGKSWSWGDDEDSFPVALWDDFDGRIFDISYIPGEYGTQIQGFVRPEDYEYEARGNDIPEDDDLMDEGQGTPRFWLGMGGKEDTYTISEDGMEITGPPPFKTTRAVKGMKAIEGALKIHMTSLNLEQIMDKGPCHWKITTEKGTNRETKKETSTNVLYATGPAVGESLFGKGEKDGGGTKTRTRRKPAATTEVATEPETEVATEEKPARATRQRQTETATRPNGRKSRSTTPPTEEAADPVAEPASNGAMDDLMVKSLEAVRNIVDGMGEDGIKITRLVSHAMQQEDELGEEVVEKIAERGFIDEAIASGILTDEDGMLHVGDPAALDGLYA